MKLNKVLTVNSKDFMKTLIKISLIITSLNAFSHGGRTDSSGCHHNRKTGGYHCHKSKDTIIKPLQTREVASLEQEKKKEESNLKKNVEQMILED